MRKQLLIIILIILSCTMMTTTPQAKTTNAKLIRSFCKNRYPKKKIRIIPREKLNYTIFTHRKGTPYVYVVKFRVKSAGSNYGYTKSGLFVKFNKRVKKGKSVYVYYIYNPYSNYEDDVVARISNNTIIKF